MFKTPNIYGYTYKGWTYLGNWKREGEEVYKLYHDCKHVDGQSVFVNWSSYSAPTKEDFELWVDLGMPENVSTGPLSSKDLKDVKEILEML